MPLNEANLEDYDALVLPGRQMNPVFLRTNEKAVAFVKSFFEAGTPVTAICHGPCTLVKADVVRGRTVTSFPSIKTNLKNVAANWVVQEVVSDNGLVTSRKPNDLPAFNRKMIENIRQGKHLTQASGGR